MILYLCVRVCVCACLPVGPHEPPPPRQHAGLLPESLIWAYIVQLSSALRTIHTAGLACRVMDPSKILITGKTRYTLDQWSPASTFILITLMLQLASIFLEHVNYAFCFLLSFCFGGQAEKLWKHLLRFHFFLFIFWLRHQPMEPYGKKFWNLAHRLATFPCFFSPSFIFAPQML